MTPASKGGSAAQRYIVLATARQTVLDRARKASALTIPGLVPEEGQNEHFSFSQPYQSIGARCVSHLSYFSMVRSSTPPVRKRIWPAMVDLPASTCPMNTMLRCSLRASTGWG